MRSLLAGLSLSELNFRAQNGTSFSENLGVDWMSNICGIKRQNLPWLQKNLIYLLLDILCKSSLNVISFLLGEVWIFRWRISNDQKPEKRPHHACGACGFKKLRVFISCLLLKMGSILRVVFAGYSSSKSNISKFHSIWNAQTHLIELLRSPPCFVGKQITITTRDPGQRS